MIKIVCVRCNKEIDTKKERWINIRNFNKEKIDEEVNTHLDCWRKQYREKVQQAFDEKVKTISPVLGKIMRRLTNV